MCAPEKQADGAESLMLCIVVLSPTVYVNYRIFRQITRALSIQKKSKFVKNEHVRYTLGMKKGKNLERLITATSQARF